MRLPVWCLLLALACGSPAAPTPSPAPTAATAAPTAPTAPAALAPTGRATRVVRGYEFACALRDDGRVACWGSNTHGQLGIGHLDPEADVVDVHGLDDAIDVAAGGSSACALHRSGAISCWGGGEHGELGTGRPAESGGGLFDVPGVPAARRLFGGTPGGGDGRFCARTEDGTWCWGSPRGAVDPGTPPYARLVPPHRIPIEGVREMWIGWRDFVALEDGTGRAWESGTSVVHTVAAPTSVATSTGSSYVLHDGGAVTDESSNRGAWTVEPHPELDGAVALALHHAQPVTLREDGTLRAPRSTFENGTGLAALAPGEGPLVALTREGTVRVWSSEGSDRFASRELVLPPRTVRPAPPPLHRALAGWCSVNVFHEASTSAASTAAAAGGLLDEPFDDEADAQAALCGSSDWNTPTCDHALWAISADYRLALVIPGTPARFLGDLGIVAEGGTEQSSSVTRAIVRSEAPLSAVVEIEEDELTCDDDGEICGLDEARRRQLVIAELSDGTFVIVDVEIGVAALREAALLPTALPLPRVTVDGGEVMLEACLGRARLPIPALRAPDAPATDPAASTSAAPIPEAPVDEAAIEEAAARCGRGWSAFGEGRTADARADVEGALAVLTRGDTDRAHRAAGACLYNLGRLEEAAGSTEAARDAYRRSLALRPNPTVEARLGSLP